MPTNDRWRPSAERQIFFHQLLVGARSNWLLDALKVALAKIDPSEVQRQIAVYSPVEARKVLATVGIRDEYVFPTPVVLSTAPRLVGFYRLLLGIPQKTFYGSRTGSSLFKSMEMRGVVGPRQVSELDSFCRVMGAAFADLIAGISTDMSPRDIEDLPILTLGAQLQGSNNNRIGALATTQIFNVLQDWLEPYVESVTSREIVIRNDSGRQVRFRLGSDPDIAIDQEIAGSVERQIAIEIKGGTDRSNAHNRAGEAEKSHRKAKQAKYTRFWTIITMRGLDLAGLKVESPTTDRWFDISQVLAKSGEDWTDLQRQIAREAGIAFAPTPEVIE